MSFVIYFLSHYQIVWIMLVMYPHHFHDQDDKQRVLFHYEYYHKVN